MAVAVKKYNPGFLSDGEIIETFCVRTAEFESIVESLREMGSSSSTHSLVIGPRGSGKTHLLLRVAAEVRRDPDLSGIFPVVFAEESYEVGTCGEFWLECLAHLAEQADDDEQASLRLTYEDLRTVTDDRMLAERCLGSLLDFADRHQNRLLLVVENLNMLFSDISDPEVGWQLRKTLQTEPRIILLGSATSRFHEIDNPDHALYDIFRVLTLRPLDTAQCEALWETVSGKPSVGDTVRPLEILTGGSPRLIAIIARFGADRSFADLMANLLDLVDEHTEYFKSHLEALPAQERRVYLALARLWKPSTAREVADQSRLDTNSCSAQLRRLVERGVVAIEGGTPRRREYYLTERLYNIYYLLRRKAGADRLVAIVIEFMRCFYTPSDLGDFFKRAMQDSRSLDFLRSLPDKLADAMIAEARRLEQVGRESEALEIFDQVIQGLHSGDVPTIETRVAVALVGKSFLLGMVGRIPEAKEICDEVVDRFGSRSEPGILLSVAAAFHIRGLIWSEWGDNPKALDEYDQALAYIGAIGEPRPISMESGVINDKGMALVRSNRPTEAIAAFDEVVKLCDIVETSQIADEVADALVSKEVVLIETGGTISEFEFSLLLQCLADLEDLPPHTIDAVCGFVARIDPSRALTLIQESPAAETLLPLLTALRQELGEDPQVAKEVEEVAEDTRRRLIELKGELQLGSLTGSATLSVGKPDTD